MSVGPVIMHSEDQRWVTVTYPWLLTAPPNGFESQGAVETIENLTTSFTEDPANADDSSNPFTIVASAISADETYTQVLVQGGVDGNVYYVRVNIQTNYVQHKTDVVRVVINDGE